MHGNKARHLAAFCESAGVQFTRFDYSGHGSSAGRFEDGTITQWRDDALEILDTVCKGPQILVGSSMGAWLATLVALERPQSVAALLGIAAAPDFTDELLTPALTTVQRRHLQDGLTLEWGNHYDPAEPHRIRQALLDSGHLHRVLDRPLSIDCPVRLLHGQADDDVPWQLSMRLLEGISSADAQLLLLKGADHRFSTAPQLALIEKTLTELLAI